MSPGPDLNNIDATIGVDHTIQSPNALEMDEIMFNTDEDYCKLS